MTAINISGNATAPTITTGTARRSNFCVKRCVGLFCDSASDTISTTRESADSPASFVTSTSSAASVLIVPAKT